MSSPTASRRLRPAVVIVALLVALGGAGAVFWMTYRDEAGRLAAMPAVPPSPEQKAAPIVEKPGRPIGEDEPAFWSDVAIYQARPGRPTPIVVVKRGNQPTVKQKGFYQGLLAREVVRQALLLSAREELGALTRDVPVGDPDVAGKPDATFRIGSRFRTGENATEADPATGRITIVEGSGPTRRVIWTREFDAGMIIAPLYARLVGVVEGFSRDAFRKVFEGAGLARTAPAKVNPAEGPLPPGVEGQLGTLAEEAQFAAIRALHAAIRDKGESSALLIGLARGYATLGSLCESQWTADGTAFKARGLLYGQRAVVRDRDAPPSLRGQAYAETIAGDYRAAIRDLDAADKADGGKSIPLWATIARAYAHSDLGALAAIVKDHPDDPWPLYFRSLGLARASGRTSGNARWVCRGEIVHAARDLLVKIPDCFRIHDARAEVEGVNNLHPATTEPLEVYPKVIPTRVAAIPGLPAGVAGIEDEVEMRNRLVAAALDDSADLTWGVLARQLREIRYLLVCRRIHFLAYNLATDASGFAAENLPLVADHPNRDYVKGWSESFSDPGSARMFRGLDLADFEMKEDRMLVPIRRIDPEYSQELNALDWEHVDAGTVGGQERRVMRTDENSIFVAANNLLKYDPDSPLGRGAMIFANWDVVKPNAEAWEKDHGGGDTFVLAQLGMHALKVGKFDEAIARLEKALARSPERWIFDSLAEAYRKTDRVDRWIEAAGDYLKTEDMDLDHAHVVGDLATYLIGKGRYDRARPFAEISAESGAAWAMLQAAECCEGTDDLPAAERWVARTAVRYANNWLDWFFWCKRTNSGNARAAANFVRAQLAGGRQAASEDEEIFLVSFFLLNGKPESAVPVLKRRLAQKPADSIGNLLLALTRDKLGDAPGRDAALKAVAATPTPTAPRTAKAIGVLVDWMTQGKPEPFDPAPVDAIIGEIVPNNRANSWVMIGLVLDRIGKPEDAIPYLKRADVPECNGWPRLLAREALRVRGVEPTPWTWKVPRVPR